MTMMTRPLRTPSTRATLALAALFAALACGCGGQTLEDVVQQHLTQTGLPYVDCGSVTAGQCGSWVASQAEQKAMQCLVDARVACKPARLRLTRPTVEGQPIVTVLLTEPATPGSCQCQCQVVKIIDDTADSFSAAPGISRQTCTSLTRLEACSSLLEGSGCTSVEQL